MSRSMKDVWTLYDLREIPGSFMQLSLLKKTGSPSAAWEYEVAYRACVNGEIPRDKWCKFKTTRDDPRGPIFADRECVERVIEAAKQKAEVQRAVNLSGGEQGRVRDAAGRFSTPDTTPQNDVLPRVVSALERIAEALELMATK